MEIIKKFEPHLVTSRDKIKTDPSRVGQAVHDILCHTQEEILVQDIIDEYQKKYTAEIEQAVKTHRELFDPPFYIVVLHKKEFWSLNVLRNWFVTRQTKPSARRLRHDYPNFSNTVYSFDKRIDEIKLLWTMPTEQDCNTIMKCPQMYDPQLVTWIQQFQTGELDREV